MQILRLYPRASRPRRFSLTRELFAFARRQSQTLQPRPVDLNEAFHTSFFDKVIDKNIEMKLIPANLQPVKSRPRTNRTGPHAPLPWHRQAAWRIHPRLP